VPRGVCPRWFPAPDGKLFPHAVGCLRVPYAPRMEFGTHTRWRTVTPRTSQPGRTRVPRWGGQVRAAPPPGPPPGCACSIVSLDGCAGVFFLLGWRCRMCSRAGEVTWTLGGVRLSSSMDLVERQGRRWRERCATRGKKKERKGTAREREREGKESGNGRCQWQCRRESVAKVQVCGRRAMWHLLGCGGGSERHC